MLTTIARIEQMLFVFYWINGAFLIIKDGFLAAIFFLKKKGA
jgi:hypothetical protein